MPKSILKSLLFFASIVIIFIFVVNIKPIYSGGCEAIVSPTNISPNSTGTLNFNLGSDLGSDINWVKIDNQSNNFSILGGSKDGWSSDFTSSSITYTGGSLPTGQSSFFPVNVSTSSESPQAKWTVQVSNSIDGSNPSTCYGNTWVAISETGADLDAPVLVNGISVSGSKNYVTLSWTTDELATSNIQYGTTDSYGSSQSSSSLTTNHSVTISSLVPNTLYHFNITVSDQWGNSRDLGDETFTIPDVETVTTTITVTNTSTVTKTITKEIKDEIKPLSKLTLDFKKIYSTAPEVNGVATDEGGVAYVLYSIDDGKNYIPAEIVGKVGSKSVNFKFIPEIKDDGNYKTRIKTIDSSGNEQISDLNELIIDRLPPKPIGAVFSVGPLLLHSDIEGYINITAGTPIKITLSTVGGPVSLEVVTNEKTFELVKNIESGLWSGNISFDRAGEVNLVIHGIDGAKNETTSFLGKIKVIDTGHSNPNSTLKVFIFDPLTSQFVLWNGTPYGIENPQKVDDRGRYKLLLPKGKYYIEVTKNGFKPLRTKIFETQRETYISTNLMLQTKKYFWDIFSNQIDIKNLESPTSESLPSLVSGHYLPDFRINGLSNTSLLGKSTLLSIISTWMPNTSEQILELQKVKESNKNSAIYVVSEQNTESATSIFKKLGGYDLNFYSDSDGELYSTFNLLSLPTHIFLDRQGIVKKVISGYLPSDEISKNLLD